jgi:hypothetical protein
MSDLPAIAPSTPNRHALILPGGGMRVAYQAGVVKALHDAGLRFSFADAASGGTMNLAALLSGVSPDELCRRWRTLPVHRFVSLRNVEAYLKFPRTGALGDFDGIEAAVFPHLGIDPVALRRAEGTAAGFNVCDFGEKIAVSVPQHEMSRELLLAAISLPLATPPVDYLGKVWTDAVWIRDCNLLAPVRAGANRLWVAWCIGNTPRFGDGLLEQYVHMIEMAAIGRLNEDLAAIADLNRRIAGGERPYGHEVPIEVTVIGPEQPIPLDPDFLAGRIDAASLVSYGYRDAQRVLGRATPTPLDTNATKMRERGQGLHFREVMRGRITFGETDPDLGFKSNAAMPVAIHATIDIDDMRRFIRDPDHIGGLTGHIELHRKGGWLPSVRGRFGLFTPSGEPGLFYMIYGMQIMIDGKPYYFDGRKHVRVALPWKLWRATTTLFVQLREGDENGPVAAAGRVSLGPIELLDLLATLHAAGCRSRWERMRALWRFIGFFARRLNGIYLLRRRFA